jgi:hypothetical protein
VNVHLLERDGDMMFGRKRLRLPERCGRKSIDNTSRPCSASQTPLRPSPSATARTRPDFGSSPLQDERK